MCETCQYQYLETRNGTRYRQLFVKGRGFTAERIYRETIGEEARTPEQVAEDFELPLEAVREAIDYCTHNEELLRQEREEALARSREFERKYPPLRPPDWRPEE
jgi:uncharacterized protein (DUF433 family)